MKLVVLSRSGAIPSTRRLVEAATARGHEVRVMPATDVEVQLEGDTSTLLYRHRRLRAPDVVIPRIAASIASYGLTVLEQFAYHGAALLNSAHAIGQSRNPARCLQLLARAGLSIPVTVMARNVMGLSDSLDRLGGFPVLVKLLQGSERRGVMVCESQQSLEAALEAVLGLGHNVVIQQYVQGASRDLRVFVVGHTALAAVSRRARAGRFTRTLARHGRLEACELTGALRHAAETAARATELDVCAVDLLELDDGVKVFEVNASPAVVDMEEVSGLDLATPVIQLAEARVTSRAVGT